LQVVPATNFYSRLNLYMAGKKKRKKTDKLDSDKVKRIKEEKSKAARAEKKKKDSKTDRSKKKAHGERKKILESEKQEIWRRNYVLIGIVAVLVILNLMPLYFRRKATSDLDNVPPASESREEAGSEEGPDVQSPTQSGEEAEQEAEPITEEEMKSWKIYRNAAYGFELKYPGSWTAPEVIKPEGSSRYIFKVSFRNNNEQGYKESKGFDVLIYRSIVKDGNLKPTYTDNLTIKETAAPDYGNCKELDTVSIGKNKYTAVEVSVLPEDPCFYEAYFLSFQKGSNIYDIVPVPEEGVGYPGYHGKKKTEKTLPEFEAMLATFNLLQVASRKATVVKRISAPKPVAETKSVGGKRTCAKKNDKPRKSKQHKSKHMDMECCLDPDEIPNPWCTY